MPEQLKPCPICSSLSVGLCPGEDEITHEIYNQAFCTSCGVSGPRVFADEISAIAAWNSMPRALTWTTEPPKVAGWYLRRHNIAGRWSEADVMNFTRLSVKNSIIRSAMIQWAGPIPTPLEQEES